MAWYCIDGFKLDREVMFVFGQVVTAILSHRVERHKHRTANPPSNLLDVMARIAPIQYHD